MVEFALILTVMMGLFVGTFELMVLFRKRSDLATATRMAARQASELWVETTDENDFKELLEDYVYDEMEIMGYSRGWMDGDIVDSDPNDHVRVIITAAELIDDPSDPNAAIISDSPDTQPDICVYGQYIQVELEMDWTFAVLPFDQLFGGTNGQAGMLSETALVRCWRGS